MREQSRKVENEDHSLLLRVEQVKYRKTGPGKSPLGVFYIYDDRIEWINDSDSNDKMVIHLFKIKVQRISPPNKPKVQLQLCMINEDQATFVFMNAKSNQEQLLQERDMVKEVLQQALVRHRQMTSQKAAKGSANKDQEEKIKILEQNSHLHQLYLYLVKEKLISSQDFWSLNYNPKSSDKEEANQRVGISGGFLSSIVESDSIGGGIRLNITSETIQSIFRTYPAVERKHLELVPHELSEQEFWSRFFQSHYFHRERNPAEPSTSTDETFADCVKMDEKNMLDLVEKGRNKLKRTLDLTSLSEDLGIISDMRSTQNLLRGPSDAKRLLVRRCNYHSERILCTMEEELGSSLNSHAKKNGCDVIQLETVENSANHENENTSSTNNSDNKTQEQIFDMELESHELAEFGTRSDQIYCPLSAYNPPRKEQNCIPSENIHHAKQTLLKTLETTSSIFEEKNQFTFFDNLAVNFIDPHSTSQLEPDLKTHINFQGLNRTAIEKIRLVHSGLTELLRHFWHCFPPKINEIKQKIYLMDEVLARFENEQLSECENQYGSIYIQHCKEMLDLAKNRFKSFTATQRD